MNKRFVGYSIGKILQVISGTFFIPLFISIYENRQMGSLVFLKNAETFSFTISIIFSFLFGSLLVLIGKRSKDFSAGAREGYAVVAFAWIGIALVGSIPMFLYFLEQLNGLSVAGILRCFTNAYFETMSGFTTTGATILNDVELVPKSLLFWRSLSHWLGGMGIITLALVIFPALGVTSYQMFRGEVPGPVAERLQPKLTETARLLWGVYVMLSGAEVILLFIGGMPLFDSLCHTFGTMATGGFSTRNASIGHYQSGFIEWVIIVFMLLAGINFLVHYKVIIQRQFASLKTNSELRFYAGTILIAIVLFSAILFFKGVAPQAVSGTHFNHQPRSEESFERHLANEGGKISTVYGSLRHAAFQVVSITTTTGYCTADFDLWPNACRIILVVLMFWGGCIGSTGGGMKMGRILIILKAGLRQLYKIMQPRRIAAVKVQKSKVEEELISNILSFAVLFLSLFIICSFLMSMIVPDLVTAIATVAATLGNIGPGLAGIGATQTYAWIPLAGKWLLIGCMLLGRLEIFTVLVILLPRAWRK